MPQNPNGKVYYEADRIIDEKLIGDDWYYYIKWKGIDENGKPWNPTWEPSSYCTPPLIASWEQQKRSAKRKLRSPYDSTSPKSSPTNTINETKKRLSESSKDDHHSSNSPAVTGGNSRVPMVVDSSESILGNNLNLPMVIEDGTPRSSMNNGSSSRAKSMDDSASKVKQASDDSSSSQPSKKRTIMLPVPLSLMQQKTYRTIFNKPQLFRAFAEADESLPLSSNSPILTARDELLMVVDHVSLVTKDDQESPAKNWMSDVSKTGKILMLRRLLMKLSDTNLKIGIALPQGKMTDIFKDFLDSHGHYYLEIHGPKSKSAGKATLDYNCERMTCVLFSTGAQDTSDELSRLDIVIAYDTSFNPQTHLWKSKSNMNIPVIRLVTKNTLEHALNYQLFHEKKVISEMNLSEIKKMMTFGLMKKNQNLTPGCEIAQFDVNGICNKVVSWIQGGMIEDLTFGMETAIEKVWSKGIVGVTLLASSRVSEKRTPEFLDDIGTPKRRKQDKEQTKNEEGNTSKSKKVRSTNSKDGSEKVSKRESSKPTSKAPPQDNPEKSIVEQDVSEEMAEDKTLNQDLSKPVIEKTSGQSSGSTPNKSKVSPLEEIVTVENWKQKFNDLQPKFKNQEDTISELQQEKDKYLGLVNELSAELSSTRTQLLDAQMQGKRFKSQYETSDGETSQELSSIQEKLTEALRTISKTKLDLEAKEAENDRMKKEIEESKSTTKSMKCQLKVLQEESAALRFQLRTDSPGKFTRRTETMDEQIKMLTAENNSLRMQCELYEKQVKMAEENEIRNLDIANLLMRVRGKNPEDVEKYLETRRSEIMDGVNESIDISDNFSNGCLTPNGADPLSPRQLTNGSSRYPYSLGKCKNKFRAIEYMNDDENLGY